MSVIRVENLGKCYTLQHQGQGRGRSGDGLRHALQDALSAPFRRFSSFFRPNNQQPITNNSSHREDFWALKDVSFEVKEGEVVGIIGRNGAGKSTLLKILSRITEPTTGRIGLKGRVASLLEVGTGFHPELTGRENIYLNGAILGMSRAEVKRKFDEIVDFSGVEKFLDTPVKRYSSGMYVRLAFAVAAHLEPEILIVDEVLAVGDTEFQNKCLGKMREVASGGRTVLFVSHNLAAVQSLCSSGLRFERGRLVQADTAEAVVSRYVRSSSASRDGDHSSRRRSGLDSSFQFVQLQTRDKRGNPVTSFGVHESFQIVVTYEARQEIANLDLSLRVYRADGLPIFTSLQSELTPSALGKRMAGVCAYSLDVPAHLLMPGEYYITVAAHPPQGRVVDVLDAGANFDVHDTGTPYQAYGNYQAIGSVLLRIQWTELSGSVGASA